MANSIRHARELVTKWAVIYLFIFFFCPWPTFPSYIHTHTHTHSHIQSFSHNSSYLPYRLFLLYTHTLCIFLSFPFLS
ncbi:hypothetical protein E2C01_027171 [Portunus trituberculatus]|uniref:Uncharacterized protein n=1 Tax=Portunus trituberculatus TaxID=210409 RepID=A0A5B7EKM2_PORTR|nr:hypothetical protein [Portunus trituberculatus]